MKNNKPNNVMLISLVLIAALFFVFGPTTNANAMERTSQNGDMEINGVPNSYYVTVNKTYDSRDYAYVPGNIYHREYRSPFWYSGTLYLFSYIHEPDANVYWATYKGTIYAD